MRKFLSLLVLVAIWFLAATYAGVPSLFLPSPASVFNAFVQWANTGDLWLDAIASIGRVFAAFGMSFVFALPTALIMERVTPTRPLLEALVDFFRYVPVPALVPLTVLLFGVGETSKIVLLFVGTYFQLVLLFVEAYRRVPRHYRDLFYCLKFGEPRIWIEMTKCIGPEVLDASRVTIGWCWTYVIIAELVAADHGIGHFIKEAQRFSNTPSVFAGILVMAAIGFVTDLAFRMAMPITFPYTATIGGVERT